MLQKQNKAFVMRHPHNNAALEHHSLLKYYFWCLHKPLIISCVVYMTSLLCHLFFLHFTINIVLIKHGPPTYATHFESIYTHMLKVLLTQNIETYEMKG